MNDDIMPKDDRRAAVLLVGAPASGKSTWGKKFAEKVGATYISTDGIRTEIGKGEGDQTVSPAAFEIARERMKRALSNGKHVVIDATNIDGDSRRPFVKIARDFDAYKVAVTFEVSRDELLKRDAQRERHVGPEVIDRMLSKYKRPSTTNFDKVIVK